MLEEEKKIKKNTNKRFKDLSRRGEKEGQKRRGKEEERFKQKSFRERSATKRTTTTKERDFETKNAFKKRIPGRKRDDD